jgi:hypothetical protein
MNYPKTAGKQRQLDEQTLDENALDEKLSVNSCGRCQTSVWQIDRPTEWRNRSAITAGCPPLGGVASPQLLVCQQDFVQIRGDVNVFPAKVFQPCAIGLIRVDQKRHQVPNRDG